ncbi:E3 ubiquitin-protein ligase TRIM71 [Bienertia sinuspersici]
MQLGLSSIEHILSGCKSTVLLMNMIGHQGVAAVKEWRNHKVNIGMDNNPNYQHLCSLGTQNTWFLMMVGSYALSA